MKKLSTVLFLALFCLNSEAGSMEKATFAGGCFWCMEPPFEQLNGVSSVLSGYTGGDKKKPTYEEVSSGTTKHLEAIQVTYDPKVITYDDLLEVFWRNVDPTDDGGQFVDRGPQYATAIFYHDSKQKKQAEASKKKLGDSKRFKKPIITPILEAKEFFPAEDYHQDYYKKSSLRYKFYRSRSGRDAFIDKKWGDNKKYKPTEKAIASASSSSFKKPSKDELKKKLSPIQYKVTQEDGTEPAFKNEYWDNKVHGIYVDVVSGEPLFSSLDKYKSGTGWPSFTRPLKEDNIISKEDRGFFSIRTEVRSKNADSHLGHVFDDGPPPTGKRYCINSAALRFIPVKDLEKEGYKEFLPLFKDVK